MRIIKLRTAKPNVFWFMDNIHLTPYNDTSPPFDFDEVYDEAKQKIYAAVNVTCHLQILEIGSTAEPLIDIIQSTEPVYELPNQQYQYAPRSIIIAEEESSMEQTETPVDISIELEPPEINTEFEPTEEDMKAARKLLPKKVGIIQDTLDAMSNTKETRRFVLACIRVEKKYKKRKSVSEYLEKRFLEIPPEV